MNYEDAVKSIWRHSKGALSDEAALLKEIVRYATLAPSGHNTQCWRFRLGNRSVAILPDLSRSTPVVDPDNHHLYVSLGCAAENLVQAARAFGFMGDAEFSPTSDGVITVALEQSKMEESPLFKAIPQRQCTRTDYYGKPLDTEELRLLEAAGTGRGVAVIMLTEREAMETVLEYVVRGNKMQINNPDFVTELETWIRFSDGEAIRTCDGLTVRSTGSPSAPRWLGRVLFRAFFRAKPENDKYARQIRGSAGIAVFVSNAIDNRITNVSYSSSEVRHETLRRSQDPRETAFESRLPSQERPLARRDRQTPGCRSSVRPPVAQGVS